MIYTGAVYAALFALYGESLIYFTLPYLFWIAALFLLYGSYLHNRICFELSRQQLAMGGEAMNFHAPLYISS